MIPISYICEYTGVRISGWERERMEASMVYHGCDGNVSMEVPSEKAIIDPRQGGNFSRYVNHYCQPNARFLKVGIERQLYYFRRCNTFHQVRKLPLTINEGSRVHRIRFHASADKPDARDSFEGMSTCS